MPILAVSTIGLFLISAVVLALVGASYLTLRTLGRKAIEQIFGDRDSIDLHKIPLPPKTEQRSES